MCQMNQLKLSKNIDSQNFDHYVITNLLRNYIKPWIYHFSNFKLSFSTKSNLLSSNMTNKIVLRNYFDDVMFKNHVWGIRIDFYSVFGFKLVISESEIFGFWSLWDEKAFCEPYSGKLSFFEPFTWYWTWPKTFRSLVCFTSGIRAREFSAFFSSVSTIRCESFQKSTQNVQKWIIWKQALVPSWFDRFDKDRNISPNPIFCIIEHKLVIDS